MNSRQPGNPRFQVSPHEQAVVTAIPLLLRFQRLIRGLHDLPLTGATSRPITTTELCPVLCRTELSARTATRGVEPRRTRRFPLSPFSIGSAAVALLKAARHGPSPRCGRTRSVLRLGVTSKSGGQPTAPLAFYRTRSSY